MPIYKFYRITPTSTCTLNNRWHHPVKPKKAIFFIDYELPYHREHTAIWIDFLKSTKNRRTLYLHTVKIDAIRIRRRILKRWKGTDLIEVVMPVIYKTGHLEVLKTVRV